MLKPIQEKRRLLLGDKDKIQDILEEGAKSASDIAAKTLKEIKELFKMR